jgi:diaminohydroxyphosphoribosylaminopyrimidine deaminase/5-amino-6-(5-phosphoribosylamino)uracil reductase
MATEIEYMQRALALAEQARGRTKSNPLVGCVIVRDDEIVGEGYHKEFGGPHAEVLALKAAGDSARGATLYVTLEPCAHHGKTPPCADAVVAAQPARVVIAMEDPNPLVAGKGIAQLREAGIDVTVGLCEAEARTLNEAWLTWLRLGRPFVIAKAAMTLDGKIATATGQSRWVTGLEARKRVHQMRNTVDAILVGSRTLMADDPQLTTRLDDCETRDPIRIILDAGEYLDGKRRVFTQESNAPTWVAVSDATRDYPFADDVIHVPGSQDTVDMSRLMTLLGERGVTSVLIEGGGTTHASAFAAGVVDKVAFFIAPKIAGGRNAVSPVEGVGCESMDEAYKLHKLTMRPVGEDWLAEGYVRNESCLPES